MFGISSLQLEIPGVGRFCQKPIFKLTNFAHEIIGLARIAGVVIHDAACQQRDGHSHVGHFFIVEQSREQPGQELHTGEGGTAACPA